MTRLVYGFRIGLNLCVAVIAAHFCFAQALQAQEVTFRSSDNSIVVEGRFVGFDGRIVTLMSERGALSFRAEDMICEGDGCPDLGAYVPTLRLAGPQSLSGILLPALIEVYARDNGWTTSTTEHGVEIIDEALVMSFRLTTATVDSAVEAFLQQDVDGVLATREMNRSEAARAREVGLGRVTDAGQAQILGIDALVPVVSINSDRTEIPLSELITAFASDDPSYDVVLPSADDGLIQGFEQRFLRPLDLDISDDAERLDGYGDISRAVNLDDRSLSLLPVGQTGAARPLVLNGSCGLALSASPLNLKTEDYPLTLPVMLYLPERQQHPEIRAFLEWLRTPAAHLVVRRSGLVDLAAVPIPLSEQGERLANAIQSAGTEVSLGELQRMMRILSPQVRMSTTFRFEPGSTRLDGQSRANVLQLAQAIRDGRYGGKRLMFVGFSDGRGPALANRDLSSARAEAIRRAVEGALDGRVPRTVRLETEAFGEALPMACDDSIWGQQINRRVELWMQDLD